MYASYTELEPHFEAVDKQARRAGGVESARRSTFEKAVLKLHHSLSLYQRLKNSLRPEDAHDFRAELAEFQAVLEPGLAAVAKHEAGGTVDQAALSKLARLVQRYQMLSPGGVPVDHPAGPPGAASAMPGPTSARASSTSSGPARSAPRRWPMPTWPPPITTSSRPRSIRRWPVTRHWLAERFAPEVKKGPL